VAPSFLRSLRSRDGDKVTGRHPRRWQDPLTDGPNRYTAYLGCRLAWPHRENYYEW